jgi:hypothetical protein
LSLEFQTNPKLKKTRNSLNKAGRVLGGSFKAGLSGSLAQITSDQIIPDDALGGFGEALDGAIGGAVAGAQLGAVGGPLGMAIGAAVGGAVGLAFDVFNNEQLMSSIKNIGTKLYDIVVVDLPKAIIEGFNKATDEVKSWFSSFEFTNPFSGTREIVPESERAGIPILKASGGYISGPGGPRDDKIPAMLSNGEFVIQASAVKKFGAGFLNMLNQGIMPRGFMDGGFVTLTNDKRTFEAEIKKQRQILGAAEKSGDNSKVKLAVNAIELAEKGLALVEAQLAKYDENGNLVIPTGATGAASTPGGAGGGEDGDKIQGETLAEGFQEDFRRGFYEALKSGDFSEFATQLGDSFTNRVIESFSTGFTDSLFKGLKLDENLEKLFDGVKDFAGDTTTKISETILGSFGESELGDGSLLKSLGNIAKSLFGSISSLFKGASDSLTGMFSGFGGGGGGFSLGGLTSGISSLFGGFSGLPIFDILFGGAGLGLSFSQGGIVPNTPYSQIGKDSVPAMLTPGELVVPADKVKDFGKENKGSQQTFNINVSGDVSRQTRKEIAKMLPEITSGVNMVNKENNFRR